MIRCNFLPLDGASIQRENRNARAAPSALKPLHFYLPRCIAAPTQTAGQLLANPVEMEDKLMLTYGLVMFGLFLLAALLS